MLPKLGEVLQPASMLGARTGRRNCQSASLRGTVDGQSTQLWTLLLCSVHRFTEVVQSKLEEEDKVRTKGTPYRKSVHRISVV